MTLIREKVNVIVNVEGEEVETAVTRCSIPDRWSDHLEMGRRNVSIANRKSTKAETAQSFLLLPTGRNCCLKTSYVLIAQVLNTKQISVLARKVVNDVTDDITPPSA